MKSRTVATLFLIAIPLGISSAFAQWVQCANQPSGAINCTTANVGIGITSPTQKLHVLGNAFISAGDLYLENDRVIRAGGGNQAMLYRSSTNGIYVGSGDTNDFMVFNAGGQEKVRIATSGNVGIGTSNPQQRLDIFGRARLSDGLNFGEIFTGSSGGLMAFHVGTISNIPLAFYTASGAPQMVLVPAGNLGIGTTSPVSKLDVRGGGWFENGVTDHAIRILPGTTGGTHLIESNYRTAGGFLALRLSANSINYPNQLYLDPAGNVGMGTSAPVEKLHVEGNIHVSGNINAKYQDVAEWVPASADLMPGTVVVLDPMTPNTVRASDREYDESVAGVVSPQPGLLLGEQGASKEMIATTGRVRVRVDATRAPIRIGDLLVTSDKLGLAMRSQPIEVGAVRIHRPGTVIGKALEPLPEGSGEILVLLSLQ